MGGGGNYFDSMESFFSALVCRTVYHRLQLIWHLMYARPSLSIIINNVKRKMKFERETQR